MNDENKVPWYNKDEILKKNPSLFHYTNFLNLRSILSSGGLLASVYSETNDRSEGMVAKRILCGRLAEEAFKYVFNNAELCAKLLQNDIDPEAMCKHDAAVFYDAALKTSSLKPSIVSFSSHGSEHHLQNGILSMWRSYCAGEGGICLGFNTKSITEQINKTVNKYKFSYLLLDFINYGTESDGFKDRFDDCDDVFRALQQFLETENNKQLPHFSHDTIIKILLLACTTKHPDFSDERELRMICAYNDDSNDEREEPIRVGRRMLTPLRTASILS